MRSVYGAGGYYPEDWFYDLCDELGFVVWQDFMFACAVYDLTPEFEENIRAEFIDNVKRLRHHASLGLWCGNNEMEEFVYAKNSWLTKPQEVRDYYLMYERILPEIVREYDPQTFYWPSSRLQADVWMSRRIRSAVTCITGMYGTATSRLQSIGSSISVSCRSSDSSPSRPLRRSRHSRTILLT